MEITLKEIRRETPSTTSFIFDKPVGFDFKAGQFAQWAFPVSVCDERCNKRPFSFATSPAEDYLMVTTRRGVSALKKAMETFVPGTKIQLTKPLGRFVLPPDIGSVLMIAGGIGITPLRSMINYVIDTNSKQSITLLYSNKSPDEIVFRKELESYEKQSEYIQIIFTVTDQSTVPSDWNGEVGRITEDLIKKYIKHDTHIFTCGPKAMVDAMREMLKTIGFPEEKVHREDFSGY